MADEPRLDLDEVVDGEVGFDLDEDLFDFDEVMPAEDPSDDDIDLDEIFAAFQDAEADAQELLQEDEPSLDLEETGTLPDEAASSERVQPPAVSEAEAFADDALPSVAASEVRANKTALPSAPLVVQGGAGRYLLLILLSMTVLNLIIAVYTFQSAGSIREELSRTGQEMSKTAAKIQDGVESQTKTVQGTYLPIVPPDPRDHPALQSALVDIETGHYTEARTRLYALLAVLDRMDPEERDELEARATYLMARSVHAQADEKLAREEGR